MKPVCVTICDYPRGDLADIEVRLAVRNELPGWDIESVSVPSFRTIAAGFAIAQVAGSSLALNSDPENFLIYANCAPRKDNEDKRKNNEGEGLVYAELKSGVRIVAVNSGYSLSFLKDEIATLSSSNTIESAW